MSHRTTSLNYTTKNGNSQKYVDFYMSHNKITKYLEKNTF